MARFAMTSLTGIAIPGRVHLCPNARPMRLGDEAG